MGLSRKAILGGDASGNGLWVHCVSRCVRRAYLCGDGYEHRKEFVEKRLQLLAEHAAVEMGAYSVMSNHFHVVLRMRRDLSAGWTAEDIAQRWLTLFPNKFSWNEAGTAPSPEAVASAARGSMIEEWRYRLTDLGWMMKALKETLSRRFNREDRCGGAFWEGRFKSTVLKDQPALIACMVYADLNPIRAKMADSPEASSHTAIQKRILARQGFSAAKQLHATKKNAAKEGDKAQETLVACGLRSDAKHMEDGLWLTPLARCTVLPSATLNGLASLNDDGRLSGSREYGYPMSPEEYITLVDLTGRIIRSDKRGAIPAELKPILDRLDIAVADWIKIMTGWRQFLGRLIGSAATRINAASHYGLNWIQNRCALFGPKPKPKAPAG